MTSIFFTGFMHFIILPGLTVPMVWMYDLTPTLHYINGTAEILGGLGSILTGVTRIQTRLIPLAALGLSLLVVGAMVYHASRGEYLYIAKNVILLPNRLNELGQQFVW